MAQINKPTEYFNTKLYTGNSTTGHAITGVGFQPDWVWIKARNIAEEHHVFDVVRGASTNLNTNNTSVDSSSIPLSSFDSDGFTLGSANSAINGSSYTYASWNWLAGGTASSNTDGSITSQVSASTTSGFSIVTYTGTGSDATIGHGLNSAPEMILQKNTDFAYNWYSWHKDIGIANYIELNTNSVAESTDSGGDSWNNTLPTSSVFSVGSDGGTNRSGDTHLAYCFHSVKGYSKIGKYQGNGSSSNPPFIYTGFKVGWVMIKNNSATDSWFIHDSKRDGYNDDNEYLRANESSAEGSGINRCSLYSNGFTVPTTDKSHNTSGSNYIYMAFAESPLVGTNNIPATAR